MKLKINSPKAYSGIQQCFPLCYFLYFVFHIESPTSFNGLFILVIIFLSFNSTFFFVFVPITFFWENFLFLCHFLSFLLFRILIPFILFSFSCFSKFHHFPVYFDVCLSYSRFTKCSAIWMSIL